MAGKESLVFNIDAKLAPGAKQSFVDQFNAAGAEGQRALINQFNGSEIKQQVVINPVFEGEDLNKVFKGWAASLQQVGGIQDELEKKAKRITEIEKGSLTNLRQLVNTYKQQRDELNPVVTKVNEYGKVVKYANERWVEANAKVQQFSRQLQIASASNFWDKIKAELNLGPLLNAGKTVNDLVNTFQSLSIIVGQVLAPVNALIETLGRLQQIDLTFKSIGQGPAEIAKVFADSTGIALKYGVSLNTVREGFTQLTPTVVAAGGTIDDTSAILDSLSSRFAAFGLSAEKSKRVMNGIIQAFGKGKLMAEELTQQISEADPAFRVDLAKALNISQKELGEWVKEGRLTADVLIDIIPKMQKTSSTFGQLGQSALDATVSLLKGKVTIEQVRNQINTLNQLNLENLSNLFKPLLASFLAIQAALTDFTTAFLKLESARTIIEFFNGLGIAIATAVVAITKLIQVVLAVVDPFFFVINAVDGFFQSLIGIRPIITLIAAAVGVAFTNSLISAVGGLSKVQAAVKITGEILSGTLTGAVNNAKTAIGGLQSGFNALKAAPAAAGAAFDGFITSLTGIDVNQQKARRSANQYKQELSYLPASLVEASVSAAQLGDSTDDAAKKTAKAGTASKVAADGVGELADEALDAADGQGKLSKTTLGVVAALAVVAAGWYIYEQNLKDVKQETDALDNSLKTLKDDLRDFQTKLNLSQGTADDFADRLEKTKTKTFDLGNAIRDIPVIDTVLGFFGDTDREVIDQLRRSIREYIDALDSIEPVAKKAEQAIKDYNSEAASPETTQAVVQQAKTAIQSYDAIIASATRLRDALEQKAKSGGGLSEEEKRRLLELNKIIDQTIGKRQRLVELAKQKNIPLGIEITGVDIALDTVSELEERLKSFKELKANAQVGTTGREKIEQDIIAIEGILKALATNVTEAKIKISYEEDKAGLANAVSVADALLDRYKAVQDLNQAGFDLTKSQLSYKLQEVEAEKAAAEERGASAVTIKGYESQIKAIKDQERGVERQAILARIQGLAGAQEQERQILLLKQAQQRLEADAALAAAQRAEIEAKLATAKAAQNYWDAQAKGASQEQLTALNNIYQKTKEVEAIATRQVGIEQGRITTLGAVQRIEQETLNIKQQTERKTLDAQAAQLGLNTSINQGAKETEKISTGSGLGDAASDVKTEISGVSTAAGTAKTTVQGLTNQINATDKGVYEDVATGIGNSSTKANDLKGRLDDVNSSVDRIISPVDDVATNLGDAAESGSDFASNLKNLSANSTKAIAADFKSAATSAGLINKTNVAQAINNAIAPADRFGSSLDVASTSVDQIDSKLRALDGTTISVNVNVNGGLPGRFTGGPVAAGSLYRVNELGKEAFLSASGRLSMINKPAFGEWRAPSAGTVIPAHLTSLLNIPRGGVKLPSGASSRVSRATRDLNSSKGITRAITSALRATGGIERDQQSRIQATQALQLGRLTNAINELARKNWNVDVKVRNTGGTAYLDALNQRL